MENPEKALENVLDPNFDANLRKVSFDSVKTNARKKEGKGLCLAF